MRAHVRASRAASFFGMAAGLLFVLLGFIVVIPVFGAFGWVWTGMAVLMTAYNAVNAFSDRGLPHMEVDIEPPAAVPTAPRATVEERLAHLASLRSRGVITQDEEEQRRREVLREV